MERICGDVVSYSSVSFLNILENFEVPRIVDFLSLDCEGAETLVMSTFPWNKHIFVTMSIERPDSVLHETLEKEGYVKLGWHGTDIFYVRREFFPDLHAVVERLQQTGSPDLHIEAAAN